MRNETRKSDQPPAGRRLESTDWSPRAKARRLSGPTGGPRQFGGSGSGNEFVERLVQAEMPRLLSIARRHSVCADDAHDACQRAMEILIRRAGSLEESTAAAWLKTVVKHEAMAVRAERVKAVARTEPDLDRLPSSSRPDDTLDRMERLSVASEALSTIKPREAEALLLQAEGHSYHDIAAANGWTYTKVNRLITEGSRAFRSRVASIDAGIECSELVGYFAAHPADGKAPVLTRTMRLHLSRCVACRTETRTHNARPHHAIAAGLAGALHERLFRAIQMSSAWVSERSVHFGTKAQTAIEAASAGKLTAVALSAAALASGGAAVGQVAVTDHPAPPRTSTRQLSPDRQTETSSGSSTTGAESPYQSGSVPPRPPLEKQVPAPVPAAAEFDPMSGQTKADSSPPANSVHAAATHQQSINKSSGTAVQPEFGP